MTDHPKLDERAIMALGIIRDGLTGGGDYLDDAEYPSHIVDFLRGRVEVVAEKPVAIDDINLEDLNVAEEIEQLFRDLKTTRDEFKAGDSAEKIAFFRLAVGLLEKLVTLAERANNVRQVGQFYTGVMTVLEEFLEPAEITRVRDRFAEFKV